MRVTREKRPPRPTRRYAQRPANYDSTISNRCTYWLSNNYLLVISFFILIFTSTFSTSSKADAFDPTTVVCLDATLCPEYVSRCDKTNSEGRKDCEPEDCTSTEFFYHRECISVNCALNPLKPIQYGWTCQPKPQCELKTDEYRASDGNCIPCPHPGVFDNDICNFCPDNQVYQPTEQACVKSECADGYHEEDGICKINDCPEGTIRNQQWGFCEKIPDPTPPQCTENQTLQNGICVDKDIDISCDPESKFAFLCQWHAEFKIFLIALNNYFSQVLQELLSTRQANETLYGNLLTFLFEWSEQLKQQQNENNGSQQTASDYSYNDRKIIIQNQEKQLAQDKEFQDETRDFYEFMKKEKDDSENPDNPNNGSVIEEQDIQTDEQQRVNWSATCPVSQAPKDISLNGLPATQLGFDNSEMCLIAQKMRPLVILAGAFISMLIIAGGLRK